MLKWAVNESHIRQSHLQTIPFNTNHHNDLENNQIQNSNQQKSINSTRRSLNNVNSCYIKREKLRRKSSGHELTNIHKKYLLNNKENHLTSTPLPLTKQINSPIRKLDSLKDLSNITNESFMVIKTPNQTPTNKIYDTEIITTPNTLTNNKNNNNNNNNPLQYATTLPTFDIEYSPCGIIPGPLLALRGLGIADSYFEKPRYLPNEFPGYRKRQLTTNTENSNDITYNTNTKNLTKRFHPIENIDCKTNNNIIGPILNNYDESLSSSKMGDTTLDKMIDAILESARKERRIPKSKQLHIMSPTYTPGDDPASDLNEFWDEPNSIYRQNDTNIKNINIGDPGGTNIIYNEREVRTPDYYFNNLLDNLPSTSSVNNNNNNNNVVNINDINDDYNISCHLQRQRAVRRKRKLSMASTNFIKSTVKNSAQKLFAAHNTLLRKNNHNQLLDNRQNQLKKQKLSNEINNFSPDSGRNSASDFDDSNDENHCIKRRLSFSPI